jgi:hypothetical protein
MKLSEIEDQIILNGKLIGTIHQLRNRYYYKTTIYESGLAKGNFKTKKECVESCFDETLNLYKKLTNLFN